MDESSRDSQARADAQALRRWVAGLAGTVAGLAVALGFVLVRGRDGSIARRDVGTDVAERGQAVARLVEQGAGAFDSHPDPDVGKLLQPNLVERAFAGARLSTNRFGFRERDHAFAKPAGTVRVVLLGDSLVMGYGVEAEDRLGVALERELAARSESTHAVEVLHFGVGSWNVRSETAFLRRSLGELRPDLVVHVVVGNDLNDANGVRGFGADAHFTPQHPRHADGLVLRRPLSSRWDSRRETPLLFALDGESRGRWSEAGRDVAELGRATRGAGGEYLLLAMVPEFEPLVARYLAAELAPDEVAYVSQGFARDTTYWVAPGDPHWNRAGHAVVAELVYGLIAARGLLPALGALERWDAAQRRVAEIHDVGLAQARDEEGLRARGAALELRSALDFTAGDEANAAQVYGGVDQQGRVSPYASLVLARDGAHLELRARLLDRPELTGGVARVFADSALLGELELGASGVVERRWELPAELAREPFLAVRIECDDWIQSFDGGYRCLALQLERIAIVP